MTAQMSINQAGLPAGTPGVARTDGLDTGALVTLSSLGVGGTHLFELLWVPAEDTTAEASLAVTGDPRVFTYSPDTMSFGEYRIKLTEDAGLETESIQILIFGIRLPLSDLLIPALNTVADPTASLLNKGPLVVAKSENNAVDFADVTLNVFDYTGWWRQMRELFLIVEAGGVGVGEANLGANVGGATGTVFRDKTGVTLNFKTLNDSTRITLTNNADTIDIATDAELNTGTNVGGATGTVFRDKTSEAFNFKTLNGSTRITLTNNADTIDIATDAELNTGVNVGAGAGDVFRDKTSEAFNFRTLTGLGGISVANNVDVIEIDGSSIVPGETNLGANVGSGADVFRDKTGVTLNFRGINPVNGINAVVNVDNIDVGAIIGTRDYNDQDLIDAKTITFETLLDNGNSGATATVDFADAQQQTITLNAATPALTIDPPPGQANGLVLFVVQDATGGRQPTFSSNVRWSNNGIVPTFTADPDAIDILHFVYDGTDMFGFFNENFA